MSVLLLLFFSFTSYSQDVGYRTTDVGAEFQYTSDFTSYQLQLGLNTKKHHYFSLRGGYIKIKEQTTREHNSE